MRVTAIAGVTDDRGELLGQIALVLPDATIWVYRSQLAAHWARTPGRPQGWIGGYERSRDAETALRAYVAGLADPTPRPGPDEWLDEIGPRTR